MASTASRVSPQSHDGSNPAPKATIHPPGRSHKDRVLQEIGLASKLRQTEVAGNSKQPSDEVERLHLMVKWTPEATALGFLTTPADWLVQYEVVSK